MATQRMLSIFQGEDKVDVFPPIYQVGTTTPQNITGWALSFAMASISGDDAVLLTKTTGNGITLTVPTQGLLAVTFEPADTADLDADVLYRYELRRTDAGFNKVLFYGRFKVVDSVHL